MKKLMLTALTAAVLGASGTVFAQASNYEAEQAAKRPPQNPNNITPSGPLPGTPESRGNSGWTPDQAYGNNPQGYRVYPRAAAVPALPREVQRQRERERLAAERRERETVAAQRLEREREIAAAQRREREIAAAQRREREREISANRRGRDRDGDGINNRRDRYPDEPTRW